MRVLCIFVFAMILLTACTDRIICPAFQSTYILDDSTRTAYFSYAWKLDESTRQQYIASLGQPDTTQLDSGATAAVGNNNPWAEYYAHAGRYVQPPEQVRKNKYGIIKIEPYWLKNYKLRTAPMENVLAPEREETGPVDEGEFYASDFASNDSLGTTSLDSLAVGGDSLVVAAEEVPASVKTKKEPRYRFNYDPNDNFNAEQDYYNKYFGELLVDNRPLPEEVPADTLNNAATVPDSLQVKKGKGLGGLFKRKKNKSGDEEPAPEETTEEEAPSSGEENEEGEGG